MKIKIGIRYNLIYPILLTIFTFLRKIDTILMNEINNFTGSLFLTLLMFLSELIPGLILYMSQIVFKSNSKINSLNNKNSSNSNSIREYMFILAISYFDFIEFILSTYYLPNFKIKLNSLEVRLGNIATIFAAFFYHFLLKYNIFKHQKFSLLIIFFCLVSIIISEFFFKCILESFEQKEFFFVLSLIIINYIFLSSIVIIEKFLLEYNKINAYKMLIIEGIFGLIITSGYAITQSPFKEIKNIYKNEKNKFFLLCIFLIIYFLLSAGRNTYRILTNIKYSPMTKIIADSFLDPLIIVCYFLFKNDLHNFFFFIINLILSIIMNFFGLVFNDFIILYCYNLQHDTYYEISKRAHKIEKIKPFQDSHIRKTIDDDDEYEISFQINKTNEF